MLPFYFVFLLFMVFIYFFMNYNITYFISPMGRFYRIVTNIFCLPVCYCIRFKRKIMNHITVIQRTVQLTEQRFFSYQKIEIFKMGIRIYEIEHLL